MKINLKPAQLRLLVNLFSLLGIGFFFILSPVIGKVPGSVKPVVKAAFISEPVLPSLSGVEAPELTAQGVFALDLDSGSILYDKNPHLLLKPASLTKIMTSLVAMDYYQEDSVLTVVNGEASLGNTADLLKGDQLTALDVLYALLVPSGNDAAVTLAENYPGGYRLFLDKMNQKVAELGLKNTHFVNVSGVESLDHYTTAYDIAMITRSALGRQRFASIVSTKDITIQSLKGNTYPLASTNILLGKPGILGVKTGWTPESGECLVILAERDSHRILISLLNSQDRFGEGQKLVNWIFENFTWQ
jgi:D-alanyl-D-alanine carboxypeptidase (penicillin-binding protein 5/6)